MHKNRLSFIVAALSLIVALNLSACGAPAADTPAPTTEPTAAPAATESAVTAEATAEADEDTATAEPAAEATATVASTGAGSEPNNARAEAAELAVGLTEDNLAAGDEDWFKIAVPNGAELAVTIITAADADGLFVILSDAAENELWSEYDLGPAMTKAVARLMNNSTGGTYYLQVAGGEGGYTLELTIAAQQDGGMAGDAADTLGAANALGADALAMPISGRLGDDDTEDWFKFGVEAGSVLEVAMEAGADADGLGVAVFDVDQNEIWSEYDLGPGMSKRFSQTVNTSAGGTYYLEVFGGSGAYTVAIGSSKQNDAASGDDAGDALGQAVSIAAGTYSGQVGDTDGEDWYTFAVPDAQVLSVSFTVQPGAESVCVALYDADQNEIWSEYDVAAKKTVAKSYVVADDAGGPYYLQVFTGKGGYQFTVELATQDDAASGGDAGNDLGSALEIELGAFSGIMGDTDTDDWYALALPDSGVVDLTFELGDGDATATVWVYDADQNEMWAEYDLASGTSAAYTMEGEAGATWYVQIFGASGSYTLTLE